MLGNTIRYFVFEKSDVHEVKNVEFKFSEPMSIACSMRVCQSPKDEQLASGGSDKTD